MFAKIANLDWKAAGSAAFGAAVGASGVPQSVVDAVKVLYAWLLG